MTVAALGAFFLVWVNGAVGIIGNEENQANLLFFGVLAVAVVGSLIARFRAKGMALTFYAYRARAGSRRGVAISNDLGAAGPIWPRIIGADSDLLRVLVAVRLALQPSGETRAAAVYGFAFLR